MLSGVQLGLLGTVLHQCVGQTSDALGRWIDRPARIRFDAVEQVPLKDATGILGSGDEPICCCASELRGRLTGHIVLAFTDDSGLALADLLLGQPRGTASAWNEIEMSAALETMNILSCALLNALADALPAERHESRELLPAPPRFRRDFAESLLQFVLTDQIESDADALLARIQFEIDQEPVDWTLLLVPDRDSLAVLGNLLT